MKHRSNAAHPKPGFSPQQIVVLILFAVLGFSTLTLAGYVLLAGNPAAPSATRVAQVGPDSPTLPPTWTAAPRTETPPASTPVPALAMPALPASCAQAGTGYQQGTVKHVVDGRTIEVQDGENVLRVGYAGIEIPHTEPASAAEQAAAQKARELIEGQPVVLVKDVTEQDSAGRVLRYVFSGSRFINFELARGGFATVLSNSPDKACAIFLAQAEQQARVEGLGIWQNTPVPTRTFVPFVTLDPNKTACSCSKRTLCSDFQTHAAAQACLNICNDYSSKLDEDRDGIACENLP